MTLESSALLLAWVAIVILSFAVAGVLRQIRTIVVGQMPRPVAGPPLGAKAPPIEGLGADGSRLLVFADTSCSACDQVLPELMIRIREGGSLEQGGVVILFRDSANGLADNMVPQAQVLSDQEEAFRRYEVPATPFAVAVKQGAIRDASPIGSVSTLEAFLLRNSLRGAG